MFQDHEPDYKELLRSLPIGVYLVDRDRRIVLWSEGAARITGYLEQEVLGRHCQDNLLLHCDANGLSLCGQNCPLALTMHDGHSREADVFALHRDGFRVPVRVRATPIRDNDGMIIGAAECFDELPGGLPARVSAPASEQADDATGLPDADAMAGRLRRALDDFRQTGVPFGVLIVSINNLDRVFRADGRTATAAILSATGQTLAKNIGPSDVAGRWLKDEFMVLLRGVGVATMTEASRSLLRIAGLESIPWWGDRLSVAISAGGSVVCPGDTPEAMVLRATSALGTAVGNGDGTVVVV